MRTRPLLLSALFASAFAALVLPLAAQTTPPATPPETPAPVPAAPATVTPAPAAPADTTAKPADTTPAPAPAAPAPAPADATAKPADANAPATPPAPPSDITVKDTETHPVGIATKGKDATGKDTLSVDFPDEDIRTILRNVADLFELNIIIPETLQGKTTIKLRDVTWRQIFQNVLSPVGYTYVEDGNIIKIISNDSLLQEPTQTEVFVLNYAKASEVMPTVSGLVSSAGSKIVVDSRTNSLVITETSSRLTRIKAIIEQLDRATDQVMIETKFIEVSAGDARNLGVNWSMLQNYKVGVKADGTSSNSNGQTSSDGVNGTGTATTNNTAASTSSQSLGGAPTSALTTTANMASTTALNTLYSLLNNGSTNRQISAVFSADEIGLVFSALTALNGTKVVSNPTVVTLNNTEATINVGEEDPIPSYAYNDQRGTFEVSGFQYKSIGINLKVTPQVNSRGFIKLNVTPEVSQKNGSVNFGGAGGASIPIIATRKASTQVSLKDGYTMGIGGLLTSQTTNADTKVPLLGSIPGLGYLFRQTTKNIVSTNLLIFITAKSIAADGAPVERIFDSRQVRGMGLHREELPGYRDGSDPFVPDVPAKARKK